MTVELFSVGGQFLGSVGVPYENPPVLLWDQKVFLPDPEAEAPEGVAWYREAIFWSVPLDDVGPWRYTDCGARVMRTEQGVPE